MFDKAIQFLKDHKEIALATSEGNLPKLRIFQIMKQEGHVLYFATSSKKAVYRELRQNPNVENGYTTTTPYCPVFIRAMTRWNISVCQ